MKSESSRADPLSQGQRSRNYTDSQVGNGLVESEIVIRKRFEIEFDIYTALEEFVELSRSKSYNDANKYFEEVLHPYMKYFPVFAEYAFNMIRQAKYDTLGRTLKFRVVNKEVQNEERSFLEFLELHVDFERGGKARRVLDRLRQLYSRIPRSAAGHNEITVSFILQRVADFSHWST